MPLIQDVDIRPGGMRAKAVYLDGNRVWCPRSPVSAPLSGSGVLTAGFGKGASASLAGGGTLSATVTKATPSITKINSVSAGFSNADATLVFPAFTATTGNSVIVAATIYQGGGSISSVTDNAGNTYTLCGSIVGGDGNHKMGMFVADNITGHASLVVTVNFASASGFRRGVAAQYSGLKTSGSYDAGSTVKFDSPSTTTHTTNSVTTTAANELVVGWFVVWDNPIAFSQSGLWEIVGNDANSAVMVGQSVSSTGTYSPAVNTVTANQFVSIARSFKGS